jgi:CubicO group peptidase (beta-lactamase class C family)
VKDSGPVLAPVTALLEEARKQGVAPGLSTVVLAGGELVHSSVHGDARIEPDRVALTSGQLFDVASLTKVMATTTLAALLEETGQLPLDSPVARFLPRFARAGKEGVTLRHLLTHSSGLPRWRPYYEQAMGDPVARLAFAPPAQRPPERLAEAFARGKLLVQEAVLSESLEAEPGTRAVYSDIGFMALGWVLERVCGEPLDWLCQEYIFGPLALLDTFFVDELALARRGQSSSGARKGRIFVATERCKHRHEVNCGMVNDDNAWAMGGVAGHAGLFSTARDVAALGRVWLDALRGRGSILGQRTAAIFSTRDRTPGSTRALGWDTPSAEGSSLGKRFGRGPRGAIGHLAFTGCSLWIDVDSDVVVALLTNRCHPSRENELIREFRPKFHDAVAGALGI